MRFSTTPNTPSRAIPARIEPQVAVADQLAAEFCRP